ncbi:MAG: InlB B-repeat-containing protein [Bacilli bacterium]|nr:InlB B-repeat-containing protein [Bacilli bacterium]
MKKIIITLILCFLSVFITSCKKTYLITLDYQDERGIVELQLSGTVELEEPIREGYKFLGWLTEDGTYFEEDVFTEDTHLTADWFELNKKYGLFYDPKGGTLPSEYAKSYLSGTKTILPIPTKEYHEFEGWYFDEEFTDGPYYEIPELTSSSKTLYAKWIDVAEYKTIEYVLKDGNLPEEAIHKYIPGKTYEILPASKDGYFFRGWYDNPAYKGNVYRLIDETFNEDLKLYAKWEEETLENAYISIYGDSISTFEGYLPKGYAAYYPINPINVLTVEDTWWYSAIMRLNARYLSNASYSNTGVVTTGSAEALKGTETSRIEIMRINDQDPDIIIIFLGVNDCKRGIKKDSFKEGYMLMIDRMQTIYPSTKIVLCTLNACSFVETKYQALKDEYNEAITELANTYDLPLVKLHEVITNETKDLHMANMLHPNRIGMEAIADEVVKVLKEEFKNE